MLFSWLLTRRFLSLANTPELALDFSKYSYEARPTRAVGGAGGLRGGGPV